MPAPALQKDLSTENEPFHLATQVHQLHFHAILITLFAWVLPLAAADAHHDCWPAGRLPTV